MIRAALALLMMTTGAQAQGIADEALQQFADAQAQLERAETAEDRLNALASAITAYDASLGMLRAAARDMAEAEAVQAEALAIQQTQISRLLGVLSAVDRTPQVVRRAHPDGPAATYRAGLLVAGMTPVLEAEAERLSQLLTQQQTLSAQQASVQQALEDGRRDVVAASAALEAAMGDEGGLPQLFVEDRVEATLLSTGAETLATFADQLATARPDPATVLVPEGNLALPVDGYILPDDASGRPGIRIAAAPRALVSTPVTATVLFHGPLLDYGNVVILEPAPSLLFVLAGLNEVFVQPGRILPAGAPIGLMPDAQTYDDGILTENLGIETGQRAQSLYLEVREGQTSAQTDAWFALE